MRASARAMTGELGCCSRRADRIWERGQRWAREKEEVERRLSDGMDGGAVHQDGDTGQGGAVEMKSFILDGVD